MFAILILHTLILHSGNNIAILPNPNCDSLVKGCYNLAQYKQLCFLYGIDLKRLKFSIQSYSAIICTNPFQLVFSHKDVI